MRAAEMAPESRRMVRVELHRPPDPVDAFVGLAEPGEQLAHLHDHQVVVGVERQRAILMIARPRHLVADDGDGRQDAMDVGVVVVERDRPLELELHLAEG